MIGSCHIPSLLTGSVHSVLPPMSANGPPHLGFADLHEDLCGPIGYATAQKRHQRAALHLIGDFQASRIQKSGRQVD